MTPTPQDAQSRTTPLGKIGRAVKPIAAVLLTLAPALAAFAAYPGFVTQDGPAHAYNAHILARSFDPNSPFRAAFSVNWEPLPNWAGHLALMGLVTALPPRVADRAMTALTLVAFAAAAVWLRGRVVGSRGTPVAAALAALLALNITWLFGFTSFLLGACLFPVTLGVWWSGRDDGFSPRRSATLAGLAVAGYFCHLVSLGLTAFGLAVLELLTSGRRRPGRAVTTALGLLPLLPLAVVYTRLMHRGGGGLAPEWQFLKRPFSPRSWVTQLGWVDPLSLARKDVVPFVEGYSAAWCGALAPVVWLAAGLALALAATWIGRRRDGGELRGWRVLAALLIVGGVVTPDTLGASHGHYLPQRVVLLGLVALVPVLRLDADGWLGRGAALALSGALALQTATVWDYGRTSEWTAGRILRAAPAVGTGNRVATLLAGIRTRFRANPLLHADCGLGIGTGNIIWSDYEARLYYFPVRFRSGLDRPNAREFEEIALMDAPELADARACRWDCLLTAHRPAIDVIVSWGLDPALDAVNAREGFAPVYADGPVRVWRRSPTAADRQ